jgi:hypothetical protein
VRHPAGWALFSAVSLAAIGLRLFDGDHGMVWVGLGATFGVATWCMWRPGDPAHGWRDRLVRRFPAERDGQV